MSRAPISGIEVFLAIVREGSLRAAARSLGVGAPAVSHQLKAFERKIGVDLLVRTTRSIELTDAGRTLLAGAAPAFKEMIDAIEGTRVIGNSNTGTLRLTLPRSAYKMIIAPVLADFQARYPDVCLDLSINEGLVDIVKEGFHAGFRLGDRLTTDMVAVRLTGAAHPVLFCGAVLSRGLWATAASARSAQPQVRSLQIRHVQPYLGTGNSSKMDKQNSSTHPRGSSLIACNLLCRLCVTATGSGGRSERSSRMIFRPEHWKRFSIHT